MSEPNLRVLRPSRKRPEPGEVFRAQLPDQRYLFGRLIRDEVAVGPMTGCLLLYLFPPSTAGDPPPLLPADDLLIPPVITNRLPWSKGYFETLERGRPFAPGELLDRHCFASLNQPGRYFDDHGTPLPGPVPPVGIWAVQSYRTMDNRISDAVGIPRATS